MMRLIAVLVRAFSFPEDPIRLVVGRWVIFILDGVRLIDSATGREYVVFGSEERQ